MIDKREFSGKLKIDTWDELSPRFQLVNNEHKKFPDALWFYSDIFKDFRDKRIRITVEELDD